MFYVVNNHLNNLYVLSNKAVGPEKKSKIINVGPTSIPVSRVRPCIKGSKEWFLFSKKTSLSTKKKMSLRAPNGFDFNLSEKTAMATQNFY